MRFRSPFWRWLPVLLALACVAAPVAVRAQTASPVAGPAASPMALDASMVTGNWAARGNDGVFGGPGSGDGQFLQPTYMAFLPDGRLLVSDETTNRIVILSTAPAAPGASPVASPPA